MRTLQRLSHVRLPSEHEARRIHNAERRKVGRKERRIWGGRLRILVRVGLSALLVALLVHWLWGGRFLAEGLVEANLVVARAPAAVRVAEVLCVAGRRCERGTPLLRLESLASREERRPLELVLERARLRLALCEAGGDLGDNDIARRGDRVAQAEREAELAESDRLVESAALASLIRQRVALELSQREEEAQQGGTVAALEQRLGEAEALVAKATLEQELSVWDADRGLVLNQQGIVSERDKVSALTAQGASQREVEGFSAAWRALASELEAARAVAALAVRRGAAALLEMDARIDEARVRIAAAGGRRELWRELAARQRELGATAEPGEGERLRELELSVLRAEVAEADARLAEHDRRGGQVLLRAEAGGVIERVFVEPDDVVEAGAALVRHYDPAHLHVVAYLERSHALEPRPGQRCRVLPLGTRLELAGRVTSVGAVWTPCPPALPRELRGPEDLRLPVHIEVAGLDQLAVLRPNLRVRILFEDDEDASRPLPGGR